MSFVIFLIVAAGIVYLVVKSNKKEKADAGVVLDQGLPYPCVIEGTIDAPPMNDRIKALAIEAQSKGLTIRGNYDTNPGNYALDVADQGGEMMLIGTGFKFVFDAAGQIDKTQSRLNLFLTDYPCEGGMNPDGSLGMAVDCGGAKVGVKGRVVGGKFVDGEIRKGWLPHIYGVLNGSYRKL